MLDSWIRQRLRTFYRNQRSKRWVPPFLIRSSLCLGPGEPAVIGWASPRRSVRRKLTEDGCPLHSAGNVRQDKRGDENRRANYVKVHHLELFYYVVRFKASRKQRGACPMG